MLNINPKMLTRLGEVERPASGTAFRAVGVADWQAKSNDNGLTSGYLRMTGIDEVRVALGQSRCG